MNLTAAQRADVAALAEAARAADGAAPYSEQSRLALADALPATHLLRTDSAGTVVGYAQVWVDGSAEIGVHPEHRRRGHGTALLAEVLGSGGARIWAYAGHPAVPVLAASTGLHPVRELWRMRAPLPLDPDPGPVLPDGVTVRQFTPGQDEDAWLAVNAAAFVGHPEQGRLTRAELDARIAADWFDPRGFFLAERDGALIAFHWTKVHWTEEHRGEAASNRLASSPDAAGEIYVLGVDPTAHGGGLGSALARIGLRHLAAQGLPSVLLYVDAANAPAVAVYRRLGFEVEAASVLYGRD